MMKWINKFGSSYQDDYINKMYDVEGTGFEPIKIPLKYKLINFLQEFTIQPIKQLENFFRRFKK